MLIPNCEYFYKNTSEELDVILCGSTNGMESDLISGLYNKAKKMNRSVVRFNYPFHDRLDKRGLGDDLKEELDVLESLLDYCMADKYEKIRLIGKSIGGVIAGKFLEKISKEDQRKFELVVLGYDLGWIKIHDFVGKIVIIQGEKDPFGGVELVKQNMEGASSTDIKYYEIAGADHGYKEPETGHPKFVSEVVDLVFEKEIAYDARRIEPNQ